jgi:hypothetical protein
MDVISTFSAVVPAEEPKAVLNLSCLSWSKLACNKQHMARSVAAQKGWSLARNASAPPLISDLTFVYGKATTSWIQISVLTTRSGCMQSAKANVTPESDSSMLLERSRCLRGSKDSVSVQPTGNTTRQQSRRGAVDTHVSDTGNVTTPLPGIESDEMRFFASVRDLECVAGGLVRTDNVKRGGACKGALTVGFHS